MVKKCGCEVMSINYGDYTEYAIEYCPLHEAAKDMYKALKLYVVHQVGTSGHYCSVCHNEIEVAIAKAEGK